MSMHQTLVASCPRHLDTNHIRMLAVSWLSTHTTHLKWYQCCTKACACSVHCACLSRQSSGESGRCARFGVQFTHQLQTQAKIEREDQPELLQSTHHMVWNGLMPYQMMCGPQQLWLVLSLSLCLRLQLRLAQWLRRAWPAAPPM